MSRDVQYLCSASMPSWRGKRKIPWNQPRRQVLNMLSEVIWWRPVIFGWTCLVWRWVLTQMCQYQCIVWGQVGVNYAPQVRMSLLPLVYSRMKHTHAAALKAPVCIAIARNTIYRYVSSRVSCTHKLDLLYHYIVFTGFFVAITLVINRDVCLNTKTHTYIHTHTHTHTSVQSVFEWVLPKVLKILIPLRHWHMLNEHSLTVQACGL